MNAYILPLAFLCVPLLIVFVAQTVFVRLKLTAVHYSLPYLPAALLSVFAVVLAAGVAGLTGVQSTPLRLQYYPGHEYYIGQNDARTAYLVWVKGEESPRFITITKTDDQPPKSYPSIENGDSPTLTLAKQGFVPWWPSWMTVRSARDSITVPTAPASTISQLHTISNKLQGDGAVIDGFRGAGQPLGERVAEYNQVVGTYNALADTVERVNFPGDIPERYSTK